MWAGGLSRVVGLHECGLEWSERFSFYDQVHTTGLYDVGSPYTVPGYETAAAVKLLATGHAAAVVRSWVLYLSIVLLLVARGSRRDSDTVSSVL